MTQDQENHPGQAHTAPGVRSGKQFFRVQGERDIQWIGDDEQWDRVHPQSKTGLRIVCPDLDCGHGLTARQYKNSRGLADKAHQGCKHFVPAGTGGPMTEEHFWLQGTLRNICRELGYEATLEANGDGVRIDLLVQGSPPFAFEVQRASTDFIARTKDRSAKGFKTVWFLPESTRPKTTTKSQRRKLPDPLFSGPCVRVGYRDRFTHEVMDLQTLQDKVWPTGGTKEVDLGCGVTVGYIRGDHLSFYSKWVPLRTFVKEVLSGEREWHPQRRIVGKKGHSWAGWLLNKDLKHYEEAKRKQVAQLEAETKHKAAGKVHMDSRDTDRRSLTIEKEPQPERQPNSAVEDLAGSNNGPQDPTESEQGQPSPQPAQPNTVTTSTVPERSHEAPPAGLWKRLWHLLFG